MRKLVLFVASALMLVAAVLSNPVLPASAASDFDDNYLTTDDLILFGVSLFPGMPACSAEDHTFDYMQLWATATHGGMPGGGSGTWQSFYGDFMDAREDGRWIIGQRTDRFGSPAYDYGSAITVVWTDDDSLYLDWDELPGGVVAKGNGVKFVEIWRKATYAGSGTCAETTVIAGDVMTNSSYPVSTRPVAPDYSPPQRWENLYMNIDDPEYPDDYSGEPVVTQRPSPKYVAMGDSYSSGEGSFSYIVGTDMDNVNECHRSDDSYPMWLRRNTNVTRDLSGYAFVACSGATTNNLFNGGSATGAWGEPAQLDALGDSTQTVTLTIGGNDLGFAEVMTDCVDSIGDAGWGCSTSTSMNNAIDARMAALAGTNSSTVYSPKGGEIHSILSVLEAIAVKAPNAKIFIAGYPKLFGTDSIDFEENLNAPSDATCVATLTATVDYFDAQWINDGVDELNGVIENAVGGAQAQQIDAEYVSPALFSGHGVCDSYSPWIHGAVVDSNRKPLSESFHPDETGMMLGYGGIFEAHLD